MGILNVPSVVISRHLFPWSPSIEVLLHITLPTDRSASHSQSYDLSMGGHLGVGELFLRQKASVHYSPFIAFANIFFCRITEELLLETLSSDYFFWLRADFFSFSH